MRTLFVNSRMPRSLLVELSASHFAARAISVQQKARRRGAPPAPQGLIPAAVQALPFPARAQRAAEMAVERLTYGEGRRHAPSQQLSTLKGFRAR